VKCGEYNKNTILHRRIATLKRLYPSLNIVTETMKEILQTETELVRICLELDKELADNSNDDGEKPIDLALKLGYPAIIEEFLRVVPHKTPALTPNISLLTMVQSTSFSDQEIENYEDLQLAK